MCKNGEIPNSLVCHFPAVSAHHGLLQHTAVFFFKRASFSTYFSVFVKICPNWNIFQAATTKNKISIDFRGVSAPSESGPAHSLPLKQMHRVYSEPFFFLSLSLRFTSCDDARPCDRSCDWLLILSNFLKNKHWERSADCVQRCFQL